MGHSWILHHVIHSGIQIHGHGDLDRWFRTNSFSLFSLKTCFFPPFNFKDSESDSSHSIHVTTNAQFPVDRTLKHPLFDALLQTSTTKNGVFAEGAYVKNICSPTLYIKSF